MLNCFMELTYTKRYTIVKSEISSFCLSLCLLLLYGSFMAETKPIPVRLTDDTLKRLDRVAERTGLGNRASVIKLCLSSFLDYIEKEGITRMQPGWSDILSDLDGRTHRYDTKQQPIMRVAETHVEYGTRKEKKKS